MLLSRTTPSAISHDALAGIAFHMVILRRHHLLSRLKHRKSIFIHRVFPRMGLAARRIKEHRERTQKQNDRTYPKLVAVEKIDIIEICLLLVQASASQQLSISSSARTC
jgi:hypothetical protein